MVDILIPGENQDYYYVNLNENFLNKVSQELIYWPERYAELLRNDNISPIPGVEISNYGASFERECRFFNGETIAGGLHGFFNIAIASAEKRGVNRVLVQDIVIENGPGSGKVSGLIQLLFD